MQSVLCGSLDSRACHWTYTQVMRHLKADDGHFKHVSWWIGGKEGKTSKVRRLGPQRRACGAAQELRQACLLGSSWCGN